MFKRITFASLAVLGAFAGPVYAQEGAGRYSGIGIGEVSASFDYDSRFGTASFDESDTGYKFFGGYLFNKNFGMEIAYWDGASPEGNLVEVSPSAFTIQGLGRIPLGNVLAIVGKIGIAFYDLDTNYGSESGNDLVYGAGVSANLGQKFELRGEWEMFEAEYNDISGEVAMISLNGIIKF